MNLKKITRLPDTELEIMKEVWNHETPVSTTQLKEYLDENRPWNISALQTLLNRLIERGFLSTEKQGKNRYYEPLVSEEDYLAFENKSFLAKLNGNSVSRFVASLYESQSISEQDLIELAELIEVKTRGSDHA